MNKNINYQILEEAYKPPYIFGISPQNINWCNNDKRLAFLWNCEGKYPKHLYYWEENLDKPVKLVDFSEIESPGNQVNQNSDKININSGNKLEQGIEEYVWSKKEERIYFLAHGDLFSVDLSTKKQKRITFSEDSRQNIGVSHDDEYISYVKDGNLWVYNKPEGNFKQLTYLEKDNATSVKSYKWHPEKSEVLAVIIEDKTMYEDILIPDYSEREVKTNQNKRSNAGGPIHKMAVKKIHLEKQKREKIKLDVENENKDQLDLKQGKIDCGIYGKLNNLKWVLNGEALMLTYVDPWYRSWSVLKSNKNSDEFEELIKQNIDPWCDPVELSFDEEGKNAYYCRYGEEWKNLYRINIPESEVNEIPSGNYDIEKVYYLEDQNQILFEAFAPDNRVRNVFQLNEENNTIEKLNLDCSGKWREAFPGSRGEMIAILSSDVFKPPEIYVYCSNNRLKDIGEKVRITNSPKPAYQNYSFPEIDDFSFNFQEKELKGKIYYPDNFDPQKEYPALLTCVYAGRGKRKFGRYDFLDYFMVNHLNYIIVGLDITHSRGYGKEFFFNYHKNLGKIDAEECVKCGKYLSDLPYISEDKLGIWGGSYGGYLVLMIMSQYPGIFDTGISWKPVTLWNNYWDSYISRRLGKPESNQDLYEECSPLYHTDSLEGNLLLVHGMQDDNVLFQDTVLLINKLVKNNKNFDLMIYPRENHSLDNYEASLSHCMSKFARYFAENMGIGPKINREIR